jgi:hypothetical protein
MQHGEAPRSDVTKDVFVLDKLRAGLPEVKAEKGSGYGYFPPVINVYSVPSGYFLSHEQIEASKQGEQFIDPNQCTPLLPQQPTLE